MADKFFNDTDAQTLKHICRLAEQAVQANDNFAEGIRQEEDISDTALIGHLNNTSLALQSISILAKSISMAE